MFSITSDCVRASAFHSTGSFTPHRPTTFPRRRCVQDDLRFCQANRIGTVPARRTITGAALARVRGKSVSFAVLRHIPHEAGQDIQVKFTTNSSDQITGSIQNARDHWKWIVMAVCVVPPEASLAFVSIFRSFVKPPTDVPFDTQKLVIVEGDAPKGGMWGRRLTGQGQFRLDRTDCGSHNSSGKLVRFPSTHLVNDLIHLHVKIHAGSEM